MAVDLEKFEAETISWLEENCPASMRKPARKPGDLVYGGRSYEFPSEDAKIWMKRCYEKGWTVPTWRWPAPISPVMAVIRRPTARMS